jgi:hypothetical protein
MMRYCAYYPEFDAVNNCGVPMEVEDFAPGVFGGDPVKDAADFEQGTRYLPTSIDGFQVDEDGSVPLGVECEGVQGFTYVALRAAADAYRKQHDLPPLIYRLVGRAPSGSPVLVWPDPARTVAEQAAGLIQAGADIVYGFSRYVTPVEIQAAVDRNASIMAIWHDFIVQVWFRTEE